MNQNIFFLCLPLLAALCSAAAIYYKPTPALGARRWLVRSMLCGAMAVLLLAHYYHPTLRESIALDLLNDAFILALAPCFYMCLLSLTSLHGIRKQDYMVFVPGALLWIGMVVCNLLMGPNEAQAALDEIVLHTHPENLTHSGIYNAYIFFGDGFYRSLAILSFIAVFYWGAWAIHRYQKRLEDYWVDISPSLTRGIRLLYVSFILFVVFGMLLAATEYRYTLSSWVIVPFAIGIAISFALMGYFARQVKCSAESMLIHSEEQSAQSETVNKQPEQACRENDPFRERLEIIEKEELYKDANLSIFSLSRRIGTNRTYLTRAFRECYGESFSEHINRLRVREADRLMKESPDMAIHDIAQHVGYNSPTSLYRNFVKIYGCAPSAMGKKQHRQI